MRRSRPSNCGRVPKFEMLAPMWSPFGEILYSVPTSRANPDIELCQIVSWRYLNCMPTEKRSEICFPYPRPNAMSVTL